MDKRLKLFCALVSAFLDFGIVFVFGAMLPAIMDTFKEDRTAAVTVQTLLIGVTNGLGIVSGALVSRFGVRKVTLIGAFLVPSGFIGAFFATSVWVLYISISCVAGHLRDVTGSYATVLVALVVLDAAVVVLLLFTRFLRARNSSARTTNTIEGAK